MDSTHTNGVLQAEPALPLCSAHLAELRASGLNDDTIRAAKIYTEYDAERIKNNLNWKTGGPQKWQHGQALVFPFRSLIGVTIPEYRRVKLSQARQSKATKLRPAKTIKYESPMGMRNYAYFAPDFAELSQDIAAPIFITEGEKKALKLWQEIRRAVVGLVGVWGFALKRERDKDGKAIGDRKLLPELEAINWQGRTVWIVYDSDAKQNAEVRRAETALAEELAKRGATVRIIRLPEGLKGVDDFLVANPVEEFWKLLETAEQAKPLGRDEAAKEAIDDPDGLGRSFMQEEGTNANGELTIRRHRENSYRNDGAVFRETADDEIRAAVHRFVKAKLDQANIDLAASWDGEGEPPNVIKVSRGLITNVLDAIESRVIVPGNISLPVWLGDGAGRPTDVLLMENGLLDLGALLANKSDVLLPHSANWFSTTNFPYKFDPAANCPKWLAFLKRNLEDDRERIAILQEWFGLCLIHDTTFHKFLVLEGDGANGKSVICAVLEAMLGTDNCSFIPLEIFAQRFQLTASVGKLANITAECGEIDRVAEGFLKSFVSGDPMAFDRKNKSPMQCAATARLTMAFNNRPRFSDRSGGLWRRMILMPMRVVIEPPDRVKGMDKPQWWADQGELPGVFCWALVGLARLKQQGGFTQSAICEGALQDYKSECNPARMFFSEMCKKDPCSGVVSESLYAIYREWMTKKGYSPLGDGKFGAEVKREFPQMIRRQASYGGKQAWCYFGIFADGAANVTV
jgi:putative DNA primase/helicase